MTKPGMEGLNWITDMKSSVQCLENSNCSIHGVSRYFNNFAKENQNFPDAYAALRLSFLSNIIFS